jgi:hypothetical protein
MPHAQALDHAQQEGTPDEEEALEPRMFAAIWALTPVCLFFPADRSQAKVFAKTAGEVLRVESLSKSKKLQGTQLMQ